MLGVFSQEATLNNHPLRVASFLAQCYFHGFNSLIIVFDSKAESLYHCHEGGRK